MPTERTWHEWLERLYNLRRDKRGSHERPHKPVLLLSILDLLDRGQVKSNQVPLTPELVNTFRRYFDVVRREDDQPSIEKGVKPAHVDILLAFMPREKWSGFSSVRFLGVIWLVFGFRADSVRFPVRLHSDLALRSLRSFAAKSLLRLLP